MLLVGGTLLYQALSDNSRDQFLQLVAGAVFSVLGLFCLFFESRLFLRWLHDTKLRDYEG